MNAQIEITPNQITETLEKSLFKGELGEKVADKIAKIYAEITTYNRTDAAKILNIGRTTLHEYEKDKLIKFRSDGRVSAADLLTFQRNFESLAEEKSSEAENEISRKTRKSRKRTF